MTESWKEWEGQPVVSSDDESVRFELTRYLGCSPAGPVFLTELGSGRGALKLRITHPADHDAHLSRWRRIAALSHPHLLLLFQCGRCRMGNTELLFVVTEYAEEDLSQILPERALTPVETLDMLKPTLAALGYLHSQGLVHGRLKPANIMAVSDQLKIASDGVRIAGEQVSAQERSPYDPPEMYAESKSVELSPSADVWSLGMTLAEILTQQRPAWDKADQKDPILPKDLPQPFLDIIRNCLRHDPQQRWTIEQIIASLQPQAPAPQRPAPLKQEIAQSKKKTAPRAWRYLVPTAVVAFAAALVAGSGILHRQPPTPVPQTEMREDAPAAKPLPVPDAPKEQKPSPVTPIASDISSQQSPKIVEASLPASPATVESRTTISDVKMNGIVQQVLPDVPQKAKDTIQGRVKVKVRVHVDASGDVTEAEIDAPSTSQYFTRLALQAAQRWKFTPAQASGEDAQREWLLRFEFGNADIKVFPSPAASKAR